MYNDNNTYYLGYGVLVTEKKITAKTKSSARAYQVLRNVYCDEIKIDILNNPKGFRPFLEQDIYTEKKKIEESGQEFVLVIPSIETLGGDESQIKEVYEKLILSMHIIVLYHRELSTYSIDNEELISIADEKARKYCVKKLETIKFNSKQGRKSKSFSVAFQKEFWKWQNFAITTEEAFEALNISKPTFLRMSKEFMTSSHVRDLYRCQFKHLMLDYQDKPVRGIAVDATTRKLVTNCQRRMGEDWDFSKVSVIAEMLDIYPVVYLEQDCYRFRLNIKSRDSLYAAMTKYYKNIDIINLIEDYFAPKDPAFDGDLPPGFSKPIPK